MAFGFYHMLIIVLIPALIGFILLISAANMSTNTPEERETKDNLHIAGGALFMPFLIVLMLVALVIVGYLIYIYTPDKILNIIRGRKVSLPVQVETVQTV